MIHKRLEIWVMPSGNVAYYRGSEFCPKERLTDEEKKFILKHVFDDLQETEKHMCEAMCPPEEDAVNEEKKVPNSVAEALHALDELLGSYEKLYILEHGAIGVHHTIGRAIRNEWGLWMIYVEDTEDTPLIAELKSLGFKHPDDMSNYILEQYVERLKKKINV